MSSETEAFSPLASVVFLGIPGFAHKPVPEQAKLRTQLDAAIASASVPLNEQDRIILDALDGAALVVLSDPRGALQAAQRAVASTSGGPFGVGVNHGPVTLSMGEGGESGLMGDGIDAAMRIAAFASAGGLVVSRSFRDVLAESAPDLAVQFQPAGTLLTRMSARMNSFQSMMRQRAHVLAGAWEWSCSRVSEYWLSVSARDLRCRAWWNPVSRHFWHSTFDRRGRSLSTV